jgi:hypothetical protein
LLTHSFCLSSMRLIYLEIIEPFVKHSSVTVIVSQAYHLQRVINYSITFEALKYLFSLNFFIVFVIGLLLQFNFYHNPKVLHLLILVYFSLVYPAFFLWISLLNKQIPLQVPSSDQLLILLLLFHLLLYS